MVTAEWWERLQNQFCNSEFQGHLLINYVFQCFHLNRANPSYFYHCLLCDRISPRNLCIKLLMHLWMRVSFEHRSPDASIALYGFKKNMLKNLKSTGNDV